MPASVNDSMGEGLKKLMSQIAQLMVLPDADLQFLTQLQGTITGYLRQQATNQASAQSGVGGGSSISDVMPGGGGGGMPAGMGQPGPGPQPGDAGGMSGGGMMGLSPGAPNPDELRRLLSAGSSGG